MIYFSLSLPNLEKVSRSNSESLDLVPSDFSFQSNLDDSKSISGYVFTLNGGVVSWKSFKQWRVADSVIDSEYIAANEAAKEAI